MVFIRPVILRDAATTDAYTQQKYSYLRARQLDAGIERRGLIKDPAARLPDLDELITQLPDSGEGMITQMPVAPATQSTDTPQ
jgi:type II secretory pathway component GspD/PulD (secretin)